MIDERSESAGGGSPAGSGGAGGEAPRGIDRYVFVRLKDETQRDAAIARCRDALAGASEVLSLSTGTPADDTAKRWDVGIVIRCADLAGLAALLARPAVAAFFDGWLGEHAVVVKSWSFTAS